MTVLRYGIYLDVQSETRIYSVFRENNRKEVKVLEKVLELITKEVGDAFEAAGYDRELGRVTISNRPDLCD